MKILLVEDDQPTGELLSAALTTHHYTVDVATDGQTGLELATLWHYDLIMLDVQIPKLDGISLCRQLRLQGNTAPILILTAKGSSDDIIAGLDTGADDYVTKPCQPDQLLARIRALLRRGNSTVPTILTWGDLCLDPATALVTYQQHPISLRPKEYSLLELLLRYPQRIFSRNMILDHLWTVDDFPTEHAVTNLIKDLRRQLKTAGVTEEIIETVYGLGYRLKTLPPEALKEQTEATTNAEAGEIQEKANKRQQGLATIGRLTEEFRASINQRIEPLAKMVRLLQTSELSLEQRSKVREEAHRLTGSLGTFGYLTASNYLRSIEHLLMGDAPLEPQQIEQIGQLFQQLQQEIVHFPAHSVESTVSAHTSYALMVGQEAKLAAVMRQEALNWGFQLEVAMDWSTALQFLKQMAPAVILLMLNEFNPKQEGLTVLEKLQQEFSHIPVLTIAEEDCLDDRVQVTRLGSKRYFSQPISPAKVFETITQLSQPQGVEAKVMIVDDDAEMLMVLANFLKPWGLQVTCIRDPSQFWQMLTLTQPDVLLLDVEMPTFNGIELCQVVRQDSKYGDLPILVVTGHTDQASMQQVFAAGADDLIGKPVLGPELVTRVVSRVERSRLRWQIEQLRQQQAQLFQQQSRTDALTQVDNRRAFDEYLQQVWQRLLGEMGPLSLILCDIDCFKQYNDRYGHLMGDVCLKQVAKAIQSCLSHSSDRVARYGGEEFSVILPNTSLSGALAVADRIQRAIAELKIQHEDSSCSSYVTLSLGITGTIPNPERSVNDLLATADRALYAAKEKSRNTYCLYPL